MVKDILLHGNESGADPYDISIAYTVTRLALVVFIIIKLFKKV